MQRSKNVYHKGDRVGMLTVIEDLGASNSQYYYLTKCDCGKESKVRGSDLSRRTKRNKYTTSCGCVNNLSGKGSHSWRGCGDIPLGLFSKIKQTAKWRNIEFLITIEDISEQWEKQEKKCYLSGIELNIKSRDNRTASLDRLDSNIGYTKENIRFCHKHINMMKGVYDKDYFIEICNSVAEANRC